jgi:DNA polymerase V
MDKVFALVDCNSFYCSCEQVFRPELEGKAVAVLSNNDGCVVSRTPEAKKLQIKMGTPYFQVKHFVENKKLHCFSSNYALYADLSSKVMQTLAQFTPHLEVYSIDEAFLDLSGMKDYDLHLYAKAMKEAVLKNVHIPVSVGIGPTKVLSKLANHLAKKSKKAQGIVDLSLKKYQDLALQRVSIEDVWGIGSASAAKLKMIGIKTAKDFRDYKNTAHIQRLLTIVGRKIQEELKGESCLPLEEFAAKRKQILSSKTFSQTITDLEQLKEAVSTYTSTAAEKLRKQDSLCSLIHVHIRTNPFQNTTQYYNQSYQVLLSPTSDTRKLIKAALKALESIYIPHYEYKKAGIILGNIVDKDQVQLNFLDPAQSDSFSDDQLMKSMDYINQTQGKDTLKVGSCGINPPWKMLRDFKSPSYTTRWSDILKVK